jgi:hypothetical protein
MPYYYRGGGRGFRTEDTTTPQPLQDPLALQQARQQDDWMRMQAGAGQGGKAGQGGGKFGGPANTKKPDPTGAMPGDTFGQKGFPFHSFANKGNTPFDAGGAGGVGGFSSGGGGVSPFGGSGVNQSVFAPKPTTKPPQTGNWAPGQGGTPFPGLVGPGGIPIHFTPNPWWNNPLGGIGGAPNLLGSKGFPFHS